MEQTTESDEKKRPYHSRVCQRQAEETRQRILMAARSRFESQGYVATTLEAIAELAEVSPKDDLSREINRKKGLHHGSLPSIQNASNC